MKQTPLVRKTPLKPRKGFTAMRTELRRTRLAPASGKKAEGKAVAMRAAIRRNKAVPATAAEKRRWSAARVRGCVACYLNETEGGRARASYGQNLEIHHLLSGGKRRGHRYTVCLCHFHHQGKRLIYVDIGYTDHAVVYGPSFGHQPRAFRATYRKDDDLLALQDWMIDNLPVRFPEAA